MCYLYDITKCFVRNDEIKLWNQNLFNSVWKPRIASVSNCQFWLPYQAEQSVCSNFARVELEASENWQLSLLRYYKCSGAFSKCYRAVNESVPEQLRKCNGAVTKVFRSSYESVPEQLRKCSVAINKWSGAVSKCSGVVNKSCGTLISSLL